MLKKIFMLLLLGIFTLGAISPALAFEEGKDYMVLPEAIQIPNADNTLVKVFSYSCPFCYKYDKSVSPKVIPSLPEGVTFKPFHLATKGTYGAQGSEIFAVLTVKDLANGISDFYSEKSLLKKAKMAYYKAYHDKKERWDSGPEAFYKTGLDAVGMSREEFEAAKNTPEVKALLAEWDAAYEVAKIQGIPGFVVNGKYLIYTKSIKGIDPMLDLIKELLKK